ncbi:uncharacterized protein LOC131018743 [Salvia miltiorrhiza]|uniref:uncharacterized protein LOC131018743 n=1 Tax=Salvia miltiorrhiza TaxID=226208 RepID=UPI0025AC7515|nr:uncharacterized protein LOC131018743 [Salvia miltiorrhiza]
MTKETAALMNVSSDSMKTAEEQSSIPRVSYSNKVQQSTTKPADVLAQDYCSLHPFKKNDHLHFDIPDDLYNQQLKRFSLALHARIILQKGESPRFAEDIKKELQQRWGISAPWQIIPLGKGFFTLRFSGESDLAKAKSKAFWKLKTGILKIREWVPLFNPYKETAALSQVWLQIYYLPHELWHPDIISGLARSAGTPIKIDGSTFLGAVGHYARVLIEMDVTKDIVYNLTVNRGSASFEIEFVYENIPYFCGICRKVGHSADKCRKNSEEKEVRKDEEEDGSKNRRANAPAAKDSGRFLDKPQKEAFHAKSTKQFKAKEQVITKNSFEVLEREQDASLVEEGELEKASNSGVVSGEKAILKSKIVDNRDLTGGAPAAEGTVAPRGDDLEQRGQVFDTPVANPSIRDHLTPEEEMDWGTINKTDSIEATEEVEQIEVEDKNGQVIVNQNMNEKQFVTAVSTLVQEEMQWIKDQEIKSAEKQREAKQIQQKIDSATQ